MVKVKGPIIVIHMNSTNVKNNKSFDFIVFLVHGDISVNMNSTNVIFYISAT